MPDIVPVNNDVSTAWEPPGVYFQLRTGGGGSALANAFKRVLIWGHKLSSGTASFDTPVRCSSQSDCFTMVGQGSDIARQYQALISQAGQGKAEVYLLPIAEPSGGTAATRKIVFAGSITAAGSFDIYICGYVLSIVASSSDTPTTLGDALVTAINSNANLPCTAANSTGTVTLTMRHVGYQGNDLPIIVTQYGATGITVSAGTITYATSAGADGSATVTIGGVTITAAVANGDSVTTIATAVKNAINASGVCPVTADSALGVVTLYYKAERVVNKISAALVSVTGTTVSVDCGTVASNNSSNRPTLTTALANLANFAGGARLWISPWFNSTTVGTMATHIERYQKGDYQRDQYLFLGSNDGLATAGALPAASSPALTSLWRYNIAVCPDSPQQGYEEAARCCGLVAAEDYVPKNYDGAEIVTDASQSVPNVVPHPAVRLAPGGDDAQTAMHSYGLTPIAVSSAGTKVVVKGRTTWLTDAQLRDWGVAQHLGLLRVEFVTTGSATIRGKSIRRNGAPRSENTITLTQIKAALVARARDLDNEDLFDGVDVWKDAFRFTFNNADPNRVDGYVPLAVIRPLHTLGLVGSPQ